MAFPFILSISDAEPYALYTDRRGLALGQLAMTSDGRQFRWANNGAVLLGVGKTLCGVAPVTAHVLQTATTAGVIGDATVTMTIGATAITVDQYRDGILAIELGTGFGYAYGLDRHTSYLASATTVAIPFKRGVTLQAAVPTTSNTISFIASPYSSMVIFPATTATTACTAVSVSPIPASGTPPATPQFGWVQTKGLAAVLAIGTVVIGQNVGVPSGTAGGVLPIADDLTQVVGYVSHVATTTNHATVMLNLP